MDDHGDEMFCPSCGERMRRSMNFCPNCGEQNRKQEGHRWGPTTSGGEGAGGREPPAGPSPESEPGRRAEADGDPGYAGRRTGRGPPPEQGRGPAPAGGRAPRGGPPGEPTRPAETADLGESARPAETADLPQWRAYMPARTRRSEESTLRTIAGAVGLGLLGLVLLAVISGIVAAVGVAAGLQLGVAFVVGTVVGQLLGFMGLSLLYLRRRGLDWDRVKQYLGIRRPTLKEVGLIFGVWILMIVGMGIVGGIGQVLLDVLGAGSDTAPEQESTQIFADNPELLPLGIAMMFLVVGPCEEILFRGVIQGRLRERFSALPAIGFTAVFFASIHVFGFIGSAQAIVLGISVLVVGGLAFGAVYEYTQNLIVVSLLHGFHNSMILVFIYISETTNVESEEALVTVAGLLPV